MSYDWLRGLGLAVGKNIGSAAYGNQRGGPCVGRVPGGEGDRNHDLGDDSLDRPERVFVHVEPVGVVTGI